MKEDSPQENFPLRFQQYIKISGLALFASGVIWGILLALGLLGGYFSLFPAIPSFFFLVGILSVHYVHKILQGKKTSFPARYMLYTVAKMFLYVLFIVCALLLTDAEHRIALIVVALFCYILSLILSIRFMH